MKLESGGGRTPHGFVPRLSPEEWDKEEGHGQRGFFFLMYLFG